MSKQTAPFYEVASPAIQNPARDAVRAEAERRSRAARQTPTFATDAELEAWQASESAKIKAALAELKK